MKQMGRVRDEIASWPIVDERWYVVEYWKASEDDFGGWVSPKTKVCSRDFKTQPEAQAFIDRHDPAPGAVFQIKHEYLRERKVRDWWPAHD